MCTFCLTQKMNINYPVHLIMQNVYDHLQTLFSIEILIKCETHMEERLKKKKKKRILKTYFLQHQGDIGHTKVMNIYIYIYIYIYVTGTEKGLEKR